MSDKNLVLIHGFWSSACIWKKLADCFRRDPDLSDIRLCLFEYLSPKLRWPFSRTRIPDYDDIAQSLASWLHVTIEDGDDVAIVTHSQGGLILQRFLAWRLNDGHGGELAQIRLIVMLACPNEGSEYLRSLRAATGFRRLPQARELETLNADATKARRRVLAGVVSAQGCSAHECRIPIYVYAGSSDNIVVRSSAQSDFPNYGSLPGNHSSILDPSAPGNITFPTLKRHLIKVFAAEVANLTPPATAGPPAGQSAPDARENIPSGRPGPAMDTGPPVIEERLELTVTDQAIRSARATLGGPADHVRLAFPPTAAMADYRKALDLAEALTSPPDAATLGQIRALIQPLQKALLQAIPVLGTLDELIVEENETLG